MRLHAPRGLLRACGLLQRLAGLLLAAALVACGGRPAVEGCRRLAQLGLHALAQGAAWCVRGLG